ncbi:MAG: cupredoxin domain-containing protein [Candidatus Magnetominusculus sp. LBB02]|nr:cupredoxin domain-containing protein [Candidatus Magnetominusculus sp. LBB02]
MKKNLLAIGGIAIAIALTLVAAPLLSQRLAAGSETQGSEQVIKITAKMFEFTPSKIKLKKGVAVILDFVSLDRHHGFDCSGIGIRTDIWPGQVNKQRVVPQKAGTHEFHCDRFCGDGHEGMSGEIIVEE